VVVEIVVVVGPVVVAVAPELVVEPAAVVEGAFVVDPTAPVEEVTEFVVVGAVVEPGAMDGRDPLHADAAMATTRMPMICLDRFMRGLYAQRTRDRCTSH